MTILTACVSRRRLLRTTMLGAAASASAILSGPRRLRAQGAAVKLGVLHPVSGALSYSGQQGRLGATLAIEQDFRFVSFNYTAWYVLIVLLIIASVLGVNNLYRSRLGRAWMAVREDETAAAAMGVNTVTIKLLAFSIGASTSPPIEPGPRIIMSGASFLAKA